MNLLHCYLQSLIPTIQCVVTVIRRTEDYTHLQDCDVAEWKAKFKIGGFKQWDLTEGSFLGILKFQMSDNRKPISHMNKSLPIVRYSAAGRKSYTAHTLHCCKHACEWYCVTHEFL